MTPSAVLDDAAIASFRRGDESGVRSLYAAYGRLVHASAHRVLADRGLAEEATQQTFVQAWRAAGTLDHGRDPAPWLATIARRVAIDIQRRERRRPASPLDDVAPDASQLSVSAPSAEQLWETWEVHRAIDQLADDERRIVQMQHLEGYTQQEIADRLGIAVGTVKSRSFRAHRTLATRLRHLRAGDVEPDGES